MKYLVAVDGSEHSDDALEQAIKDAKMADAELLAVHVVNPEVLAETASEPLSDPSDADDKFVLESTKQAEIRGEAVIEEVLSIAEENDFDIKTDIIYGEEVSDEIVKFAVEEGYDLIYIGHRGLSDHHEELLGSVANEVILHAETPVMLVR